MYALFLSLVQAAVINKSLVAEGGVCNPVFDSTFQINTFQGLQQKSGWLLTVMLPNYVLPCCYVYEGAKYDPSSKIAGSGYDVVIRIMKMSKCFDKRHHIFIDNLSTTYAAAANLLKRLLSNWGNAPKPASPPAKWNYHWKTHK